MRFPLVLCLATTVSTLAAFAAAPQHARVTADFGKPADVSQWDLSLRQGQQGYEIPFDFVQGQNNATNVPLDLTGYSIRLAIRKPTGIDHASLTGTVYGTYGIFTTDAQFLASPLSDWVCTLIVTKGGDVVSQPSGKISVVNAPELDSGTLALCQSVNIPSKKWVGQFSPTNLPLGSIPIVVDGVTVTGDGTTGNPLVAPGGGGTVTEVTGSGLATVTGGPAIYNVDVSTNALNAAEADPIWTAASNLYAQTTDLTTHTNQTLAAGAHGGEADTMQTVAERGAVISEAPVTMTKSTAIGYVLNITNDTASGGGLYVQTTKSSQNTVYGKATGFGGLAVIGEGAGINSIGVEARATGSGAKALVVEGTAEQTSGTWSLATGASVNEIQTTITDTDSALATSGAIVDYVASQGSAAGGYNQRAITTDFIPTDTNFVILATNNWDYAMPNSAATPGAPENYVAKKWRLSPGETNLYINGSWYADLTGAYTNIYTANGTAVTQTVSSISTDYANPTTHSVNIAVDPDDIWVTFSIDYIGGSVATDYYHEFEVGTNK